MRDSGLKSVARAEAVSVGVKKRGARRCKSMMIYSAGQLVDTMTSVGINMVKIGDAMMEVNG
jgi:hypothetical protein